MNKHYKLAVQESRRTVAQRGDHCEERGVERVPVVVDARRVDVEHPRRLARVDTQRFEIDKSRPAWALVPVAWCYMKKAAPRALTRRAPG